MTKFVKFIKNAFCGHKRDLKAAEEREANLLSLLKTVAATARDNRDKCEAVVAEYGDFVNDVSKTLENFFSTSGTGRGPYELRVSLPALAGVRKLQQRADESLER